MSGLESVAVSVDDVPVGSTRDFLMKVLCCESAFSVSVCMCVHVSMHVCVHGLFKCLYTV